MERNGIPLCFIMFSIRLLYPIIAKIKYDVKDLKYIKIILQIILNFNNFLYILDLSHHVVCWLGVYSQPAHDTATNTEWQLPEAVLIQSVSPDDEHDMLETCRELMFLSPTNALLYYTYKMLKYTVKTSHCTAHSTHHNWKHFYQHCWKLNDVSLKNIVTLARFSMGSLMMVQMDRNM